MTGRVFFLFERNEAGGEFRRRTRARQVLLFVLLAFTTAPAGAADAQKGRRTFQQCASCHAAESDSNGFGPHLKGVVGRKAGSVPGYAYSQAMQEAGAAGLVWDEAALSAFLASPAKKLPGTKMRFYGFWFQSQIDDVIAYLKANP